MTYQFFLGLAVCVGVTGALGASETPEIGAEQEIETEYRARDWTAPVARPYGSLASWGPFEWELYRAQLSLRPSESLLLNQNILHNPDHVIVPFREVVTIWQRDDFLAWKSRWELLAPGVARDVAWENRLKATFQEVLLTDEGQLRGISPHSQAVLVATMLNRDYLEAKMRWVNEAEDALLMTHNNRREAARIVMERLSEVTKTHGDPSDEMYLRVRELIEAMAEGDVDRGEEVSEDLLDLVSSLTGDSFRQHLAGIDQSLVLNVHALHWDDVTSSPTLHQQEHLLRLALFSTLVEKGVFYDTEKVGVGLQILSLAERSFLALYPELIPLWKWVVELRPQMADLAVGSEDGDDSLLDFNRIDLGEFDFFDLDRHQIEVDLNRDQDRHLAVTLRFTPLGSQQTDSLFLHFLVQTLVNEAANIGIVKDIVARAHIDPETGVFLYKVSKAHAHLGIRLALAIQRIFQHEDRLQSLRTDFNTELSTTGKRYLRRLLRQPGSTKSCATWLTTGTNESLFMFGD